MNESQDTEKKGLNTVFTVIKITLVVLIVFIALCPLLDIKVFTFGMKGEYVARVDCIEDYYVSVYNNDVCRYYDENGEECLVFGYVDNITDYERKHEELLDILPYRRFLCFSKKAEEELYFLTDEAHTMRYGVMYVLRTSDETVHYYYRRDNPDASLDWPDWLTKENLTFSYGDTTFELTGGSLFTSDIDFTTGEHILQIEGEPCYFVK